MKPVKCDPELLRTGASNPHRTTGTPTGTRDDGPAADTKPYLDSRNLNSWRRSALDWTDSQSRNSSTKALLALIELASSMPPGKTGLRYFDEETQQTQ